MLGNLRLLDIALILVCVALVILILYLVKVVKKLSNSLGELDTVLKDVQEITDSSKATITDIINHVESITGDVSELTNKVSNTVTGVEKAMKVPLSDKGSIIDTTTRARKYYSNAKSVVFATSLIGNLAGRNKEKKLKKKLKKKYKEQLKKVKAGKE